MRTCSQKQMNIFRHWNKGNSQSVKKIITPNNYDSVNIHSPMAFFSQSHHEIFSRMFCNEIIDYDTVFVWHMFHFSFSGVRLSFNKTFLVQYWIQITWKLYSLDYTLGQTNFWITFRLIDREQWRFKYAVKILLYFGIKGSLIISKYIILKIKTNFTTLMQSVWHACVDIMSLKHIKMQRFISFIKTKSRLNDTLSVNWNTN